MAVIAQWSKKSGRAIFRMKRLTFGDLKKLQTVRVTTCGSVDDGKSTLIGRMLFDCGGLYNDQVEAVRRTMQGNNIPGIDYSYLLDGLADERLQKITIDVAYRYLSTTKRRYIIADVPGHEQYTRNMITGMSRAHVAIILVDASKGMTIQTKRHLAITSLLQVGHVLVVINKMDMVSYREKVFKKIEKEIIDYTLKLQLKDVSFIPTCAINGEMLKERGENMGWYRGLTLIDYLENVYIEADLNMVDFRFPVQTIVRPDQKFRGYAGLIASGRVELGEKVIVLPSGREATVKSVIYDMSKQDMAVAGQSVLLTLSKEIDISRGDMVVRGHNVPFVGKSLEIILIWLNINPVKNGDTYWLKHTTKLTRVHIDKIIYKIDVRTLKRTKGVNQLEVNEIGKVQISTNEPLVFDYYRLNKTTGSLIFINPEDNYATVGAGLITQKITEKSGSELKPKEGFVLWLTGLSGAGKSTIAKRLSQKLRLLGLPVEWLDGDEFRKRFNYDLGFSYQDRVNNIKRAAYVARLLAKNRINVIASFITPYEVQRRILRRSFANYIEVFVDASLAVCEKRDVKGMYQKARKNIIKGFTGLHDPYERPVNPTIHLVTDKETVKDSVERVLKYLKENSYFF